VTGAAWRLLADDGASAAGGLALDEALMAGYRRSAPPQPPTLRLYTYREHCALVGRYQHLDAEVDVTACARTQTQVSRRPTGGGAIVMGPGQLGVAVVMRAPADRRPKELIEELSGGVVAGLAELGITAAFRGKNDLEVDGRKIAGLGLYVDDDGGMLFHASVLADLDIGFMLEVLRVPAAKLAGKAVAAVAERVTTVTRETGEPWTGRRLRDVVRLGFAKHFSVTLDDAEPTAREVEAADALVRTRYAAQEWVQQDNRVPDGSGSAVLRSPHGLVRLYLTTHGDLVKNVVFTGDFNEVPTSLVEFESSLRWRRLEPRTVAEAVASTGVQNALEVPAQRLVDAVLDAGRHAHQRAAAAPVRTTGSCYFPDKG
jgi:lipoate-protein ligase A